MNILVPFLLSCNLVNADVNQTVVSLESKKIIELNPIVNTLSNDWNLVRIGAISINTLGTVLLGEYYIYPVIAVETFLIINNALVAQALNVETLEFNHTIIALTF